MNHGDHHLTMHHDYGMPIGTSAVADDDSSSNSFCQGMGMVMYMEGFQWTLNRETSCLNFYFPTWKLDTTHKFVAAMICVFIMGIVTEGITRLKHEVSQKARETSNTRRASKLWYMQTCLQGLNALAAYMLMLAIMTYSLELLCCVVLGLMVGYFLFEGDLYNHGAGSPCCNFLEDDNERDNDDGMIATLVEALLPPLADNNNDGDNDEGNIIGYDNNNDDLNNGHSCCDNAGNNS